MVLGGGGFGEFKRVCSGVRLREVGSYQAASLGGTKGRAGIGQVARRRHQSDCRRRRVTTLDED